MRIFTPKETWNLMYQWFFSPLNFSSFLFGFFIWKKKKKKKKNWCISHVWLNQCWFLLIFFFLFFLYYYFLLLSFFDVLHYYTRTKIQSPPKRLFFVFVFFSFGWPLRKTNNQTGELAIFAVYGPPTMNHRLLNRPLHFVIDEKGVP